MMRSIKKGKNTVILPHEWITVVYLFITGLLMVYNRANLDHSLYHYLFRIGFLVLIFLAVKFISPGRNPYWDFLRNFLPIAALGFLYNETGYLNNIFFYDFDHQVYSLEGYLFGLQPSLLFSEMIPFKWFAELMYLGYFSFYLIILGSLASFYFMNSRVFQFDSFVILFSFYLYFLFFILFPVTGPQFFFSGTLAAVPDGFLFGRIMRFIQRVAEVPTGAFPSSHVGISILLLFLWYKKNKKLFYWLFPVVIILIMSSVYIKAHYLIDVIAGMICVYPFYKLAEVVYVSFFQASTETLYRYRFT